MPDSKKAKSPGHEPKRRGGKDPVLRVAAELFARHGFHAVSIRDIAAACDVGVSTVLYHGRSKQHLLEEIIASSMASSGPLSAFLANLDATAITDELSFFGVYDQFVDALVQDSVEAPQTRRLWLRLLLDQPERFSSLEAHYVWPIFAETFSLLHAARAKGFIRGDDTDIRFFVLSLDWILDGFFAGGALDLDGQRKSPASRREVGKLRSFLKDYGRRWLQVPGNQLPGSQLPGGQQPRLPGKPGSKVSKGSRNRCRDPL